MSSFFSPPKPSPPPPPPPPPPTPEPLPPAPERSSTEVASAAEAQRKKYFAGGSGRASNMLTGGLGVTKDETRRAVSLLGGAGARGM